MLCRGRCHQSPRMLGHLGLSSCGLVGAVGKNGKEGSRLHTGPRRGPGLRHNLLLPAPASRDPSVSSWAPPFRTPGSRAPDSAAGGSGQTVGREGSVCPGWHVQPSICIPCALSLWRGPVISAEPGTATEATGSSTPASTPGAKCPSPGSGKQLQTVPSARGPCAPCLPRLVLQGLGQLISDQNLCLGVQGLWWQVCQLLGHRGLKTHAHIHTHMYTCTLTHTST